jgi:predicted ribosome quality control (RQC) complex YloA/Tae2 family protein
MIMTKELKNIDFQNLVLDFINESKKRFANMENNIDDIKSRLNSHDNKFDKIEAIQERMDNKINKMNNILRENLELIYTRLDVIEGVVTDIHSDFDKNIKVVNKSLASMNNRLVRLEEANSALR